MCRNKWWVAKLIDSQLWSRLSECCLQTICGVSSVYHLPPRLESSLQLLSLPWLLSLSSSSSSYVVVVVVAGWCVYRTPYCILLALYYFLLTGVELLFPYCVMLCSVLWTMDTVSRSIWIVLHRYPSAVGNLSFLEEDRVGLAVLTTSSSKGRLCYGTVNGQSKPGGEALVNYWLTHINLRLWPLKPLHKTRQDNGEKRMQALVPLYPHPCYTLN